MGLTNTFVKNIKHSIGSAIGKYRDGGGMYLQVNVVLTLYSSTAGMFKLPIVSP